MKTIYLVMESTWNGINSYQIEIGGAYFNEQKANDEADNFNKRPYNIKEGNSARVQELDVIE